VAKKKAPAKKKAAAKKAPAKAKAAARRTAPAHQRRDTRTEYAKRKARAKAAGTTVYGRRDAAARRRGWASYTQERAWRGRLTDDYVRELAEEIGGPVEPERPGALMSRAANDLVNPRGEARRPGDWRIRLLVAAGRIDEP
jgi:hypothetical protein